MRPMGAQRWERVYVVVVLVTACHGLDFLLGLFGPATAALDDSNPARFGLLLVLYATAALLLVRHHGQDILAMVGQNKLLLLLLGYAVVSCLWAIEPSASLRRSGALALTTVFCFYLALRFPPAEIVKLVAWAIALVMLGSLVVVVAMPDIGVYATEGKMGRWRGITGINITFGRVMAIGIMAVWALRRTPWKLQPYDAVLLLLLVLCNVQAQAITAVIALAAGFLGMVLIWSPRNTLLPVGLRLVLSLLFAVPAAALLATNLSDVLALLGRDPTLTNRIYIWQSAYELGLERPVWGAGFRSFWIMDYASTAFYNMFGSAGTVIGNGHNGYLDVWLELGLVGLGLVFVVLLQALLRLLAYARRHADPFREFFGGLLIFILVYSLAEKVLLEHSEIVWMLFTTGLIAARWHVRESQTETESPSVAGNSDLHGLRRPV
jgi:O-antigen ligase